MKEQNPGQAQQDRRAAGGLAVGGAICAVLSFGSGERGLAVVAAGLLIAAMMVVRRVVRHEPYAQWIAWAAVGSSALLLAWAEPFTRTVLLLWSSVCMVVAVLLATRWRDHRAR